MIGIPAELISIPSKTIVMEEGDNGMLQCPFRGAPSPILVYYRNKVSINTSNPRYKIFSNGNLIIINVTTSDEGLYECRMISNNTTSNSILRSNLTKVIIYREYY